MKPLNICIGGYIVGGPLGGLVWHHLQYVLGLHTLGHHVLFVEDSDDYPSAYNPLTNELSEDPSYGLSFIQKVFSDYGLDEKWAYFNQHNNQWYGCSKKKVESFARSADIFINLSGVHPLSSVFESIPVRVFVDTDPVFTQVMHLTEPKAFEKVEKHNSFFTFGENFGHMGCSMPDDGIKWQPTRQPVFLDAWKPRIGNDAAKWTTVMQWDSYKVRKYGSRIFGMKSASFEDYFSMPEKVKASFELAIGSATAPRERLIKGGWFLKDPLAVTLDPATYQRYIQQSKGEWSVAKHGYVSTNSGWFSERSAGYLASGRPVVVQETGFSDVLPVGMGLHSFTSPEEAIDAIELVDQNYAAHCKWAREIAEAYFCANKVLTGLLEACAVTMTP